VRSSIWVWIGVVSIHPISTSSDLGNELGHEELDVKFDDVRNRRKLYITVSKAVSS